MQNKPVRPRLWTKAVFEHVSDHNFVHMMSTCQMQQILAKSYLYHTTSSTSSASFGSNGIKGSKHMALTRLSTPHSWTIVKTALLTASPVPFTSFGRPRSCNTSKPTNTDRRSTLRSE